MESAADMLRELIMLKSSAEDDVRPIVDYVSRKLRAYGMDLRQYCQSERPAIVARRGSGGVLLSGHLDTVPRGTGWKHEDGKTVGGRLYGRGACDMKGGCAAVLTAAERLAAADVPFSVCFTTDEETGMKGAAAAAKDRAFEKAPAILVAEPTGFDIVVREKGLIQFQLGTKGVAAHASNPRLGENAISKMVDALGKLADMQQLPRDPLARMTMVVGTIRGGTQVNVVPSECAAEIDVRYPAGMTSEAVLGSVRKRLARAKCELKVIQQLDPVETDPDSEAVRTLKRVVGAGARVRGVPYATEMVMFKGDRRIAVTCGPGDPLLCHVANEHIVVSDVKRAAEIYTRFCSMMATNRQATDRRARPSSGTVSSP